MTKITYESKWRPGPAIKATILQADEICREYAASGYGLTLRQLYYQFISRDLLPNSERSYKNLGNAITKGRMAGMIDWNHLTDRGRNAALPYYSDETPAEIIRSASYGYVLDRWSTSPVRVEVWVEKEALGEVVSRAANRLQVGSMACKGYMSASEMWAAAQRFGRYIAQGQKVMLLHLGDHDPSGIDMTRDIRDRLSTFIGGDHTQQAYGQALDETGWDWGYAEAALEDLATSLGGGRSEVTDVFEVERIALNMDQIQQYDPPPNPAKLTDSRGTGYVDLYGPSSWELDALPPDVLNTLITDKIREHLDADAYNAVGTEQQRIRDIMDEAAEDVAQRLESGEDDE